jgi:mRNA-degrading endonuclease toxin of MazEF toxin-antitoxin module
MSTPDNVNENSAAAGSVPVWKTPRFQIFAAIVVGAAIVMTAVAAMNLKGSVDTSIQQGQAQVDQIKQAQEQALQKKAQQAPADKPAADKPAADKPAEESK